MIQIIIFMPYCQFTALFAQNLRINISTEVEYRILACKLQNT